MPKAFFLLFLFAIFSLKRNIDAIAQDIFWRDYVHNNIPCGAIEAAPGRYIGQAYLNGFMIATLYPYTNSAVFEFKGKKTATSNLKILCSHQPDKLYWEEVNFAVPNYEDMADAVKGGNQENKFDLYIGKAFHEGEWKIGKVVGMTEASKGLWVWNTDGRAIHLFQFQLLKFNTTTLACQRYVF